MLAILSKEGSAVGYDEEQAGLTAAAPALHSLPRRGSLTI